MPTPTLWLPEFQVNTGTADIPNITDPQVVGLSNGNILFAWTEFGTTGVATSDGSDIVGKIYDGAGNLVRDSFRLNFERFGDDESDFDIAATNDGGFMLVYVDNNGVDSRIQWERKDAAGNNTQRTEIVSEAGVGDFDNPQIAVNNTDNTSFVTFTDLIPGTATDDDIRAVRLDDQGTIITPEFFAGNITSAPQRENAVAINTNGELVSVYRDGSTTVRIDVYSPSGARLHQETVDPDGDPFDPQVTTLTNGNIVVTWTDDVNDNSLGDAGYMVFDSDLGVVLSRRGIDNIDANETSVVALPDGGFAMTWDDDSSASDIKGQLFDSAGATVGSVFTVDGTPSTSPSAGVTSDGRLVFTWISIPDVQASIWDPRDGIITTSTYDNPPLNFVDGDIIYAKTTGGQIDGDGGTAERIIGSDVGDVLVGGPGNDTLEGNAGNDVLQGSTGDDSLDGGSGNDDFFYFAGVAAGADTVIGGVDTDSIVLFNSGGFDLSAAGTDWSGLERITFGAVDATAGDKTLTVDGDALEDGFGRSFAIRGQTDTSLRETIVVNMSTDTSLDLSGVSFSSGWTDGFDVIRVIGDSSDESFVGTSGSDSIVAGDGSDLLIVTEATTGQRETLDGGDGYDRIFVTSNGVIDLSDDDADIRGIEEIEFVVPGNSTIRLGSDEISDVDGLASILIDGVGGNEVTNTIEIVMNESALDLSGWTFLDWDANGLIRVQSDDSVAENITGSSQRDRIAAGEGNDTLNGGAGNDTVLGDNGADLLLGGAGADLLGGGAGADRLFGGSGDDRLFGSNGNDRLYGSLGDDLLNGGNGFDIADYRNATTDMVVNLGLAGEQQLSAQMGTETFVSVEGFWGGAGNDALLGNTGVNLLEGGGGDDRIFGGSGNDILRGGAGNDRINGGAGNDRMNGGAGGDDVLNYFNATGAVTVDLRDQGMAQTIGGGAGIDTFVGFRSIFGSNSAGRDLLYGDGADNRLLGFAGDDRLLGFGGDDALSGMQGADRLTGAAGADVLSGGGGADVFIYNFVSDSTRDSRDRITDFGLGADRIDLSAIDANTAVAGNQAFNFVGAAALNNAGDLSFVTNGTNGFVIADVDGDGTIDLSILLAGATSASASDFIL